ncbi:MULTISPECIES: GTPase Era [Actinomycetes]|uniref:GTPase Era n=2 Tax=Actinomycetes TaxID=1760 RepID=A0ABP6LSZ4_9MICC|nr:MULTISPECIES: GTPase Era [unclassified Nesterenkonia]MDS2171724.1 GTPase Era [Nesterenkonia sp. CL21]OSM44689.1 GTPase Era [Nesterenkonia sp. PF2B19]
MSTDAEITFAEHDENHRAGFASFVGRPNAGKSTLTNALVGSKVAITSSKPQTTRHTIRGIVHREDAQLVLVDTPGLHRPRTLLGQRLNDLVIDTLSEVDVVGFCLPADQKIGPGDRFIAGQLTKVPHKPVVALVTKTDTVPRDALAEQLMAVDQLGREHLAGEGRQADGFSAIIPVSAVAGDQVDVVADELAAMMPLSPPLYPQGDLTDEPEAVMVAELVREAALEDVRDELPHSIAVVVEEMVPREGRPEDRPLLDVRVSIHVERDSQKAIIIGRRGARLKQIGTQAREGIKKLLGTPVYLDLHVKVSKDWQRDAKKLGRLGF